MGVVEGPFPGLPVEDMHGGLPAGIAAVYESQEQAEAEILNVTAASERLDILAIRGLGIVGLNEALLRRELLETTKSKRIRVLYLQPHSAYAALRASEIGESAETFRQAIELGVARLDELREKTDHIIEVYFYDHMPIWRIIALDDTLFVSTYVPGYEGQTSQMFRLFDAPNGTLYRAFRRVFDELLDDSSRVERRSSQ